jgi:hypothetical protein
MFAEVCLQKHPYTPLRRCGMIVSNGVSVICFPSWRWSLARATPRSWRPRATSRPTARWPGWGPDSAVVQYLSLS